MAVSASKNLEDQSPNQFSNPQLDTKTVEEEEKSQQVKVKSENASKAQGKAVAEDKDEEEVGECGFCLFMKGGGCKESFTAWEQCIEKAENNKENIAEKCFEIISVLKKCMAADSDYYEPILKAKKMAEAKIAKELEKEKVTESSEQRNAISVLATSKTHCPVRQLLAWSVIEIFVLVTEIIIGMLVWQLRDRKIKVLIFTWKN